MSSMDRRIRARQRTRALIVDAARELFVRNGYDAVTMRAVAARIEYTPTAIYHHFRDKKHLVLECCLEDARLLAGEMRRVAEENRDPIERLRQMAVAYAGFGLRHPNHYRLMFMTELPGGELTGLDVVKGNPELDAYSVLKAAVQSAIDARLLRADYANVDATAQMLWSALHGIISLRIAKNDIRVLEWQDADDAIRLVCDTFLHGILREGVA